MFRAYPKGPAAEGRLANLNKRAGRVRNCEKSWAYAGLTKPTRISSGPGKDRSMCERRLAVLNNECLRVRRVAPPQTPSLLLTDDRPGGISVSLVTSEPPTPVFVNPVVSRTAVVVFDNRLVTGRGLAEGPLKTDTDRFRFERRLEEPAFSMPGL